MAGGDSGSDMHTAFCRSVQLGDLPSYRGSPRVDEGLDLLRTNDYDALQQRRSKYIGGRLTWAKVADVVVAGLGKALLFGDADRAVSYVDDVRSLADRLVERDAHPSARVTTQLRARIGMLVATANCIAAAVELRDGKPSSDAALGKLVALRTRWFGLKRELASHADHEWVVELVQGAAGRVLASDAGMGAKAVATRAAAAWLPVQPTPPPVPEPRVASPPADDAPPSPTRQRPHPLPDAQHFLTPPEEGVSHAEPASKRFKVDGDGPGEQVTWTDADDALF